MIEYDYSVMFKIRQYDILVSYKYPSGGVEVLILPNGHDMTTFLIKDLASIVIGIRHI